MFGADGHDKPEELRSLSSQGRGYRGKDFPRITVGAELEEKGSQGTGSAYDSRRPHRRRKSQGRARLGVERKRWRGETKLSCYSGQTLDAVCASEKPGGAFECRHRPSVAAAQRAPCIDYWLHRAKIRGAREAMLSGYREMYVRPFQVTRRPRRIALENM